MSSLASRIARTLLLAALVLAVLPAVPAASAPASTAVPAHHPDLILVGFADGVAADVRAAVHTRMGGRVEHRFEHLDLDVVRISAALDPVTVSAAYAGLAPVAYAHPNWQMRITGVPNDVLFDDEWGLHNTGQPVTGSFVRGVADADIDAPEGWDAAFGSGNFPSSGGARVGILDTGIDLGHADLLGKTKACANALTGTGIVVNGSCSDDNLHGTHVAGTVGAIANNSVGVAGVAPNAEFAIFKGLDAAGFGFYADIVAGVHWLHTTGGARIISMSIGGPQDGALDKELSEAAAAGTLLIAAAGNDGDDTANYPAFHRDVMSVAAVDAAGKRASFSNCNSDVEIGAPGVDVWSTAPGNTYVSISGTSMATPHVSGVAAMVMWRQGLDAAQTRSALRNNTEGDGGCSGVGRVNLAKTLGTTSTTTPPPSTEPGAIAGKVTDASTKSGGAIAGATVDCGTGGAATTASDGSYTISNVTPGSYSCTATATGYRSKRQSVTVSSGATTTANFALRKA